MAPGTSPGILSITGDYTQGSGGALDIEIGGLLVGSQYDRLVISGLAALAGLLDIDLINSFFPNDGDSFTIMTFGSRSGEFTRYSGLNLGGGMVFQVIYTDTSVVLVAENVVPEPSTHLLFASGLAGLVWWHRRQARRNT